MKFQIKDIREINYPCDTLILPLFEGQGLGPYKDIDSQSGGLLGKVIRSGEFQAKSESMLLIHMTEKMKPERILLTGLGRKDEISKEKIRKAGGSVASYLKKMGFKSIAFSARTIQSVNQSPADFIEGGLLSL